MIIGCRLPSRSGGSNRVAAEARANPGPTRRSRCDLSAKNFLRGNGPTGVSQQELQVSCASPKTRRPIGPAAVASPPAIALRRMTPATIPNSA